MSGHTLFVTDLDGTLLDAGSRVSPESARMLNEAIARGALFTVATARTPATVSVLLRDVDIRIPAVVMTGSALWDRATGSYSSPQYIPQPEGNLMLRATKEAAVPCFIYSLRDGVIDITHIGPVSELERRFAEERRHSPFKRFRFLGFDEIDAMPPDTLLFYAMQPNETLRPVVERIRRETRLNPYFYNDIFGPETGILEVFAPGNSKAAAIRRLARSLGADRIVAFGDNVNDLPMLRDATQAVAVANAIDEVKAAAHTLIGPNTSDAVARFILDAVSNNT